MPEKVWCSLPTNEENAIKGVINSIGGKNLTDLSINQLIEKLENNQAAGWLEVFSQYNAIPSIRNMNTAEMLGRTRSVKRKFRQNGYDQLENREFPPNQLLSLIILCYTNPTLIGPKLCKALNEGDEVNIRKEILENSAYVTAQGRVVPSQSNLRLVNYALSANDTSVKLPNGVLNRIREGARNKNITLAEFGCSPKIDVRSSRSINGVNQSIHLPLQVNDTDTGPMLINGSSAVTHNAGNSISNGDLLIGAVAFYRIFKNLPVIRPVLSNIGKDLAKATEYIGSFFSCKTPELAAQVQQKTFIPSVAKP